MTDAFMYAVAGGICGIADAFRTRVCNCIGPQNGDPVCPCQMRNVKVVNGRYVLTRDLGPVRRNEGDGDGG